MSSKRSSGVIVVLASAMVKQCSVSVSLSVLVALLRCLQVLRRSETRREDARCSSGRRVPAQARWTATRGSRANRMTAKQSVP